MLIRTDVMVPERMDILLMEKKLRIGTCGVDTPIQTRVRSFFQQHKHPVISKTTTTVLPRTITIIPIFSLKIAATDRDFLFEPVGLEQLSLFTHIMNTEVGNILMKNTMNKSVILPKNTCLGHLCKLGTEQGLIAMAFTGILEEDLFSLAKRTSSNF